MWRQIGIAATARRRSTRSTSILRRHLSSDHDRLVVVGSGVAGSAAALMAAEVYKIPVTMLFAGSKTADCNSYWAQGGIIYRNFDKASGDSAESLASDIHRAGAGLCEDSAVQKVATEGPERVKQLLLDENGPFAHVPFDRNPDGSLSLCLEASHAAPRILHRADHTGKTITECLNEAVARHPLITLQGNSVVTDLIVQNGICVGVQVLRDNSLRSELATRGVVLASGGLGGIYQHSTNPPGFNALGSSVAVASRSGVSTRELEYVQFHPTSLNIPNESRFLLTEALRGEGAILRNKQGRAFAKDFHENGELAPRDIVARGVFEESVRSGEVYLDITHRERDWLYRRFPTIHAHLQQRNLDIARDWLPVIPAAHYTCGGVSTDLHGQTSLANLYAAGEAARTGLHGGNRLASTSLLEGLVFGASVADHVGSSVDSKDVYEQSRLTLDHLTKSIRNEYNANRLEDHHPKTVQKTRRLASELLRLVRKTMWDYVGVVRTPSGLNTAMDQLEEYRQHAEELFDRYPTAESAGARDAAWSGHAVAKAAANNRVSAGAHCVVPDIYAEDSEDDESDEEDRMTAVMSQ